MTRYTEGPFRVLAGRTDDEWLLLDVNSADPAYVPRSSLPDAAVGNRVDGDLRFEGDEPTLLDARVDTETRFRFRRTDEPVFEAARTCFETARAADGADPPFSVWVLDGDEPFLAVYIVLGPDGLLERTMRDTYG